jgi:hypothetical protein
MFRQFYQRFGFCYVIRDYALIALFIWAMIRLSLEYAAIHRGLGAYGRTVWY